MKKFLLFGLVMFYLIQETILKEISLDEVQSISKNIPGGIENLTKRPQTFNCDSWQNDFVNELRANKIKHIKCMLKLRPKDNPRKNIVVDPEIRFNNIMVGYDTHFYTKIEINKEIFIFDNINPQGIRESEHRAKRTFWYNPTDPIKEDYLIKVEENKENIKYSCTEYSSLRK